MRDHDEDEEISAITPAKWSWAMVPFTFLSTVSGVLDSLAEGFSDLALGVVRHMNYTEEKEAFARDAGLEIERITSE